jgi:GNAT superfamily N-acetyltransferase
VINSVRRSDQIRRTLVKLREEPIRGHAVVCEFEGQVIGYALLISFCSNELDEKVLYIDQFFIDRAHRGQGQATNLIERLSATPYSTRWPRLAAYVVDEDKVETLEQMLRWERTTSVKALIISVWLASSFWLLMLTSMCVTDALGQLDNGQAASGLKQALTNGTTAAVNCRQTRRLFF